MIGCLRTRVHKQPIIALYFDSENELKFYNLEALLFYDIVLLNLNTDKNLPLVYIEFHMFPSVRVY